MLQLVSSGRSTMPVAVALNRSQKAVRLRLEFLRAGAKQLDHLPRQEIYLAWTALEEEQLRDTVNAGQNSAQIAKKLKRTQAAVLGHAYKLVRQQMSRPVGRPISTGAITVTGWHASPPQFGGPVFVSKRLA
ncbi:hypothetical protein [Bradyrhizobium sp. JYMT SZCCT0428]|uniref:hypothetical protein n=1 Tax=Bradyrhizobium sp. JYMT SZCCT0428 TaxID=2807673 RepID=UPI001BAAC5B8|nr:hypothetical protein [Bradyrhizobium sp. JYMT SZCCT0428]MBR1157176.1 hypothetical protein [Bradyrhizobium sp. JYMT SZCCT0428]